MKTREWMIYFARIIVISLLLFVVLSWVESRYSPSFHLTPEGVEVVYWDLK